MRKNQPSWGLVGGFLGPSEGLLAPLGSLLGASWGPAGLQSDFLRLLAHLGCHYENFVGTKNRLKRGFRSQQVRTFRKFMISTSPGTVVGVFFDAMFDTFCGVSCSEQLLYSMPRFALLL